MAPVTPGRHPVLAAHAIAASGHPLATAAALEVLSGGGNAVDAALAASAALCVVMPHMTGIGGDGFVQVVEPDGRVYAYNSGGTAGSGATLPRYAGGIPRDGLRAACIPGLPDLWALLHGRHATRPLPQLLRRAIAHAREGHLLSAEVSAAVAQQRDRLAVSPASARLFLPGGRPLPSGEMVRQPQLARTLEAFAEGGRAAFYDGEVGEALAAAFATEAEGLITTADLRAHEAVAADPISIPYRDTVVYEQPPTSQGHVLLQELGLAAAFDLGAMGHLSANAIHTLIEAKKIAFADRTAAAGDPRFVAVDWEALLSPTRAGERARAIDPKRAQQIAGADSKRTDTTQFAVGDGEGRAVTFIQSVYYPFGCAAMAGETGILLNNRMLGFSVEAEHPNVMVPGKRTVHTLNTYTLFRDGKFVLAGGTPGADFQVQTNLQILTGIIDFGLTPLEAVDAPRWGHTQGLSVVVEGRMPEEVRRELSRRGHALLVAPAWEPSLGCAQVIARTSHGGWEGVSDLRRDGATLGF